MTGLPTIPIRVVHLLPELDNMLLHLLRSLTPEEWQKQTVAKLWTVKDVAAHLLDGNIRILSMLRDGYAGEKPTIHTYQDLVNFLNGLNADWVKAMKRVSPEMLILLHEVTGTLYCDYYSTLNPQEKAVFSVAWAGEQESKNWMHLAREYTEKWLHQQQIREAANKPGLMTRTYFYPFIDTFMYALPYTYRDVEAENDTVLRLTIETEIGGDWYLKRTNRRWVLQKEIDDQPTSSISLDPDTAWKLFSKSKRPVDVQDKITITGNEELGKVALSMVSVMA